MLNNGLFQEMPGMREVEQVTEHKRLTTKEKHPHGAEGVSKDKLTGKYCRGVFEATACVEKLAEYETAEEEGRLVVLPCKVGDIVYKIMCQRDNFDDRPYRIITSVNFRLDMADDIGKTVFLTREEAEKELKEMEKGVMTYQ